MQIGSPIRVWTGRLLALALAWLTAGSLVADDALEFDRDIRPILADHCFRCHGPDAAERKGELRLDQAVDKERGIIVPGKSRKSDLIVRISSDDPDLQMPPPEAQQRLTAAQIAVLTRWIDQGAAHERHWAYIPPQASPTPTVRDRAWTRNFIDHFLLSAMEAAGQTPSPDADPVTLIRRLHFDLSGLPPTPEVAAAFTENPSEDNYLSQVDTLLSSPAYGERMATYWLDLVRYASTVGYHGDQDHAIAPYRDWVIDALNQNLPFDEFTTAQLAGDLLPNPSLDQKIATGYNRLLQTSHEGGVQPREYLAIYAADRIRNFSVVWLGATVGCAQCHDHKYDPFTTRDFYSLQAFFADIDEATHFSRSGNTLPTLRAPELNVLSPHQRRQIQEKEAQVALLRDNPPDDAAERIAALEAEIAILEKATQRTMITSAIAPRTIRILPRGDWLDDSGPVVGPAVPLVLGSIDTGERRPTRLDLARWLTDSENGIGGLSSRVFVNRIWYLFFGVGLARDLGDLGSRGRVPRHPELLDALSLQFIQSGWNIKQLVRLIVTSRAYRQASLVTAEAAESDPENQLLARQSRFRLTAEMIRDSSLSVSGLMVQQPRTGHTYPYQPAGYYRHLNFPKRSYPVDKDEDQYRRAVYMHWQRQFLHPMLRALDAPSREECTVMRAQSNTPLAALTLLNDPTFLEAARVLAARVLTADLKNESARIERLFRLTLSRPPRKEELKVVEELLVSCRNDFRQNPESAEQLLSSGMHPLPDGISMVELASWCNLCRVLLNTSEFLTRN